MFLRSNSIRGSKFFRLSVFAFVTFGVVLMLRTSSDYYSKDNQVFDFGFVSKESLVEEENSFNELEVSSSSSPVHHKKSKTKAKKKNLTEADENDRSFNIAVQPLIHQVFTFQTNNHLFIITFNKLKFLFFIFAFHLSSPQTHIHIFNITFKITNKCSHFYITFNITNKCAHLQLLCLKSFLNQLKINLVYGIDQTRPKCGPRAACGPPKFFCGP
jgi:hypothetical protein